MLLAILQGVGTDLSKTQATYFSPMDGDALTKTSMSGSKSEISLWGESLSTVCGGGLRVYRSL